MIIKTPLMKNLILIRHAKSSWDTPVQDFDRPLEPRGIKDAILVSKNFVKHLPSSLVIHSSTAKRARETAIIFAETISYPIDSIIFRDDLYTFDENKLEKSIKALPNDYENVILFGHNAAITDFVNKFGENFFDNIPTSGLVWLRFYSDYWGKIHDGKIIRTIFPKNLK